MTPLLKKLIIALGVLIVLFGAYLFSVKYNTSPDTDNNALNDVALTQASEKILTDMQKIEAIDIEESKKIFINKKFTTLVDTRVRVPEAKSGRTNPFAPIE